MMSSRRGLGIVLASMLALVSASTPASADVGPEIVAGYLDAPMSISPVDAEVTAMNVNAGSWVFIAKASVEFAGDVEVACRLKVESDFDAVTLFTGVGVRPLSLAVVHALAAPGFVVLSCQRGTEAMATIGHIKITAIRVGSLYNSALPGWSPDITGDGGGPEARAGYRDGPVTMPKASLGTIGSVPLPPGRW